MVLPAGRSRVGVGTGAMACASDGVSKLLEAAKHTVSALESVVWYAIGGGEISDEDFVFFLFVLVVSVPGFLICSCSYG